jgi:copper transport protein
MIPSWLIILAGLLRAATLPAGLLLGGAAGARLLLRHLGVADPRIETAHRRLAGGLLALLLASVPVLALVETRWESAHPFDMTLLTDLLPYTLSVTLFGVVWAAYALIVGGLWLRLQRGHLPGVGGTALLLAAWPQIGHLLPNYDLFSSRQALELGWLAAHRIGAALWLGTLAVLLLWSRMGLLRNTAWGAAFVRLAVPGLGLLLGGATGILANHGGVSTLTGGLLFSRLVQVKIGLLVALVGLGAWHFRRYRQPGAAGESRSLAGEVAVAVVAAILGAVLGVLPSPE